MKQVVTSEKIRSIIVGCKTDESVLEALNRHKVRFTQDRFTASLNLYIPVKTGKIRIYRACSRNNPYVVQMLVPVKLTYSGIPTYRPSLPIGSPYTENEFLNGGKRK